MKDRKKQQSDEVTENLKERYRNIDKEIEIYRKEKRDRIRLFYQKLRGETGKNEELPTPKVSWKQRQHLSLS